MLCCFHEMQDHILRLSNIIKTCDQKRSELAILKARIVSATIGLLFNIEQVNKTIGDVFINRDSIKDLLTTANTVDEMIEDPEEIQKTKKELIVAITTAISSIPDIEYDDYGTYHIDSRYRIRSIRDTPIDTRVMHNIGKSIKRRSNEPIQIFDAFCRKGDQLKDFSLSMESKTTFGRESSQPLGLEAKNNIDRVALGDFLGSRISNDAFDVLLAEVPIKLETNPHFPHLYKGNKDGFMDTLKYLRPNGVGVYILPYFNISSQIRDFISKNFKDVEVRKLNDDFEQYGLIAIMGIKKQDKTLNKDAFQLLMKCYDPSNMEFLRDNKFPDYYIPNNIIAIETFRGSILDTEELLNIANTSGAMDDFWNEQKVEILSEQNRRPLLPFNIGQLGLVLTSGCLDGVIQDEDGTCHVIKGRVTKSSEIERTNVDNTIEEEETISNKVEINVFLPNGEFKTLA